MLTACECDSNWLCLICPVYQDGACHINIQKTIQDSYTSLRDSNPTRSQYSRIRVSPCELGGKPSQSGPETLKSISVLHVSSGRTTCNTFSGIKDSQCRLGGHSELWDWFQSSTWLEGQNTTENPSVTPPLANRGLSTKLAMRKKTPGIKRGFWCGTNEMSSFTFPRLPIIKPLPRSANSRHTPSFIFYLYYKLFCFWHMCSS